VQEVVVGACEAKVKNSGGRIHLKKVVMQLKIEGAEIRKEVDQVKAYIASAIEEIHFNGQN